MNISVFHAVLATASQDSGMKIKETKKIRGVRKSKLTYKDKLTGIDFCDYTK